MTVNATHRAPRDLSKAAKLRWQRMYEVSEMDEPAVVLMDELWRCWDRVQQARGLIARDGIIVEEKTAHGDAKTRMNPACQVERDALAGLTRCWKLLGFDEAPPGAQ
jgi:phage terminase small subunit